VACGTRAFQEPDRFFLENDNNMLETLRGADYLATFRDNISVTSSVVKPSRWTSVTNYQSTLSKIRGEGRSRWYTGGSLKTRKSIYYFETTGNKQVTKQQHIGEEENAKLITKIIIVKKNNNNIHHPINQFRE